MDDPWLQTTIQVSAEYVEGLLLRNRDDVGRKRRKEFFVGKKMVPGETVAGDREVSSFFWLPRHRSLDLP